MTPLLMRAILRLVAIGLETTRWAAPGTFETFFSDVALEPIFFLVISEGWYWLEKKKKNNA